MAEIQSNLTQCPNGHWYNAALHSSCPYCAGGTSGAMPETAAPEGMGSFPKTAPPDAAAEGGSPFGVTLPPEGAGGAPAAGNFGATIPVAQPRDSAGAASPFGVTMIGGSLSSDGSVAEPVVGWLVCVGGPMRGTDFRLHAGNNYIGREVGDIHIHGDQQISRERDTIISFSAAKLRYYVRPDSGRNLIELNGEPVLAPMELHSYDRLTIGTTQLMFVPLCGEHFRWDEGGAHE